MMDRFVAVVVEPDVTVTWADGGVSRAWIVTQRNAFPLAAKFSGRHRRADSGWEFEVPLVPGMGLGVVEVSEGQCLIETRAAQLEDAFMGFWAGPLEDLVEHWNGLGVGHGIANIGWKGGS